ncbi:hypothetical protein U8607_20355 [Methylobacterium durans]|uniref:hypothetical protein n=1 Tax=Methylobacterium durans TaxID=2202825 RepID=UPI002AFE2ED7|nr:hypothetical protein [Methylobacterium durans]MEA1834448.1 hypothetical protein [Methylobacterium durans]
MAGFPRATSRSRQTVPQRNNLLAWIGAIGSLVGFLILNLAPFDDLLPLNRVLAAFLSALAVVWLLVELSRRGNNRP